MVPAGWYTWGMTVGERIQQAREAAGYRTAKQFAEAIGIEVGTVYSWEGAAKAKTPRLRTLRRIAEFLQVPLETLTGEATPVKPPPAPVVAPAPTQAHPGVDALAADADLCARHHVTDAELAELRRFSLPNGKPMATVAAALRGLDLLRSL